jgi:hypothetical protein
MKENLTASNIHKYGRIALAEWVKEWLQGKEPTFPTCVLNV